MFARFPFVFAAAACLAFALVPAKAIAETEQVSLEKKEAAPEPPPLSNAQVAQVLKSLDSGIVDVRKRTYAAARNRFFNQARKDFYKKILQKAAESHRHRLKSYAEKAKTAGTAFVAAESEWRTASAEALTAIMASHGSDKQKQAAMDEKFARAVRAVESLDREVKKLSPRGMRIDPGEEAARALGEVYAELAWCDGEEMDALEPHEVLEKEGMMESLGDWRTKFQERRRALLAFEDAEEFNAKLRWAKPGYPLFATQLNAGRYAVGLQPVKLDEKLSDGCLQHSEEMLREGYFSHESPHEESKTPWIRAKKAGFTGAAMGECIFAGSAAPAAAYKGWWYSDGHRHIMYGKDANTLGLGAAGSMWTLMTGSQRWD